MKGRRKLTNVIDGQIDRIVRERCNNKTIPVLDISKVFKAGYDAHATGQDLEHAVVEAYQRYHAAADPHCTCNDCILDTEGSQR